MSHDKYFYGKKLFYILLAPHSIYKKQKTESVYLILKNNYGPFSEHVFFKNFFNPQQQKMMTSANICRHFEFFL